MAKVTKLNLTEMKEFIKKRVVKLMESEEAKSLGDPMKVKMNTMTKDGGKLGKEANAADPTKVNMNSEAKNGTKDSDTGAQVEVKAGAAKGNKGSTAGQAKANMEKKTSSDASVKAGDPFVEAPKEGMNNMDEEGEDGAKTFVKAGDGGVGSQPTTVGQKKASFSEDAPKSDDKKRIADAIQMKEGMTFKNKSELVKFIQEEAAKLADLI